MVAQIDLEALFGVAWKVRQQAYVPYSKFAVGAALQAISGRIFQGCNIENLSYGLTMCAERGAVTGAISSGENDFLVLVVVAESVKPIVPCGACRQVLAEFNPDLRVVSEGIDGKRTEWMLSNLLPSPSTGILDR